MGNGHEFSIEFLTRLGLSTGGLNTSTFEIKLYEMYVALFWSVGDGKLTLFPST